MTVTVRPATPADVAEIHRLIVDLAIYEREPDAVKATPETLNTTLFAPDAQVFVFIAEIDGRIAGLALWFLTYSTWTGRPSLYLEDLFVSDWARNAGVGKALFGALAKEARMRGAARIDWAVLDWNEGAKGFYRSIGANRSTGWEPWRIEGEALSRLADR